MLIDYHCTIAEHKKDLEVKLMQVASEKDANNIHRSLNLLDEMNEYVDPNYVKVTTEEKQKATLDKFNEIMQFLQAC